MPRRAVAYLTAFVITAGAAVALAAANQPLEYLDEETGATVTVVGRPLVFVHDRSGFLGPAGDYVTLAAAAVNQSGKITYVLIAYFWWSGVPPKAELAPAAVDPLALQADDPGHTARPARRDGARGRHRSAGTSPAAWRCDALCLCHRSAHSAIHRRIPPTRAAH